MMFPFSLALDDDDWGSGSDDEMGDEELSDDEKEDDSTGDDEENEEW